ncbi:MAG TPA: hypothetical protein ENK20_04435 [Chromatiales bacterium]|nr:hypothetical protein [Chromatiales bacterium]
MRRRGFLTTVALVALVAGALPEAAVAASAKEIDIRVDAALERFHEEVAGARRFLRKAAGVLVFPRVVKAGIGIGGEYGEGALRIRGRTVDYYSIASASIGFQLGAQARTVIIVFLDKDALRRFRRSEGWRVGVDGSVALVKIGAGGTLDTINVNEPVVAFIIGQKGLMYNLTLEGSKISRLKK